MNKTAKASNTSSAVLSLLFLFFLDLCNTCARSYTDIRIPFLSSIFPLQAEKRPPVYYYNHDDNQTPTPSTRRHFLLPNCLSSASTTLLGVRGGSTTHSQTTAPLECRSNFNVCVGLNFNPTNQPTTDDGRRGQRRPTVNGQPVIGFQKDG